MKKKLFCIILCAAAAFLSGSLTASADTGPKPSVKITFNGLGGELCYATLLSSTVSTGPASVWDGNEENARHNGNKNYSYKNLNYEIWKAFVDYRDTDGYYFLQEGWQVNETKTLAWTYFPPQIFKILLYFPESNTFAVSGKYERYAFDSYYTVNLDGLKISAVDRPEYREPPAEPEPEPYREIAGIKAKRSYDFTWELTCLAARIVITVLLEIAVALLFGYRSGKQLLLITAVNGVTQIILNLLLNLINYKSGPSAFILYYILLEIIVFAAEGAVFYLFLEKLSEKHKKRFLTVVYAFTANACSFAAGLILAGLIPGIF